MSGNPFCGSLALRGRAERRSRGELSATLLPDEVDHWTRGAASFPALGSAFGNDPAAAPGGNRNSGRLSAAAAAASLYQPPDFPGHGSRADLPPSFASEAWVSGPTDPEGGTARHLTRRPWSSTSRLLSEVEAQRAQAEAIELGLLDRTSALEAAVSLQRSTASASKAEAARPWERSEAAGEGLSQKTWAEAAQSIQDAAGRTAVEAERRLQAKEALIAQLQERLRQAEDSKGAGIHTATEQVAELEQELARWQKWADEEVSKAHAQARQHVQAAETRCQTLLEDLTKERQAASDEAAATSGRLARLEAQTWSQQAEALETAMARARTEADAAIQDLTAELAAERTAGAVAMGESRARVADLQATLEAQAQKFRQTVHSSGLEVQACHSRTRDFEDLLQLQRASTSTAAEALQAAELRAAACEGQISALRRELEASTAGAAQGQRSLDVASSGQAEAERSRSEAEWRLQAAGDRLRDLELQLVQQRSTAAAELESLSSQAADLEARLEAQAWAAEEAEARVEMEAKQLIGASEGRGRQLWEQQQVLEVQLGQQRNAALSATSQLAALQEQLRHCNATAAADAERSAARSSELEGRLARQVRAAEDRATAAAAEAERCRHSGEGAAKEMEAKFAGQRKESSVEVDRLAARTADLEEKLQRQRLSMEDAWRALSSESERQQLAGEMKIRELQEQVARQRDAGSRAAESFAGRSADFQFQLDHSIRQRSETTQQLQASEVKVLELTAQLGSQCGVDAKLQQALERKAAESEARNQALDEQLRRQHQLLLEGALEAAAAKAKLAAAEKLQAAGGLEAEQRAQASEARSKVVEDELLHQREQAAATAETTALRIAGLQKQVAEQRKAAEESRTARERSLQGLSGKMLELEGELERRDQSAEGASQRLAELETQLEQQTRAMADVKTESQGLLQKLEAEKQAAASLAQTEIAGLFQQVEEQKRAAEAANTQSEGTLQKLEEQQRAAEGAKTESEGLLQDSRTKVAEMEIQLSQALAAAAEAGGEAEQSAARRSEFQQRVQTAEGRSKELSELLTQQVDASTKVQAALEQKAVEVSELNLKAEQSAALRSDLEQRVQTAEGRSKDLSEQLAQQLEASTQVQAALEQKAAEASELNLKAQAAAAEQSAALRSGLEQRVQTAEGRSKDLSEQLAQQLEASTQVQAALEQKAAEASELNLKAQAAAASEAKLRDLLQEVQKRCGELEAQAAKEKAVADEAAEKARLETELRLQAGDSRTRELAAQLASLQAVLDAEKTMQETKSTMASETQDVAGKSDTSEVAASASQNTANSRLTRSEQPANARSLLGISVHQLTTTFLDEVLAAGFSRDASVYDIAEAVIRKPGEAATCPIDGGTGAAYVQLLSGEDSIGSATHMLSYSCASPIGDIADALQQHCQDSGLDLKRTYVWICSLCSNQHRACEREEVLSSAGEGPSAEQLRNEILARMRAIGRVLALLTPWDQPHYVQRTWCLAEMHLALSLGSSCDVAAVFPPGQTQRLADQLQGKTAEGCLANAWRVLSEMRPESSEATSPAAKAALLRLLGSSCGGFAAVEAGISRQLRTWLVTAAEGRLRRLLATGTAVDLSSVARACDQVGWLLREVALHHRATAMLQDGLQLLLRSSLVASNLGSKDSLAASQLGLLSSLGTAKGTCSSNQDELLRACLDARRGHERMGTLETAAGVELLCSIGSARWTSGDQERAAEAFQEALRIRRDTRSLESQEGAVLLRNIGVVRWAQGDHEGALEVFAEARRVRERTGSLAGAGGAALLLNIGFAKADQGDSTGALEAFEEAMRLVPAAPGDYGEGSPCTGATDLRDTLGGISAPGGIDDALLPQLLAATPSGATLLSSIGVAQGNRGDQAGALSVYRQARRVREQSGALASVAGAVLLRNTGVALAGMGDHQSALQAFVEAEKLREKTGTLATSAGANLLGSLGAARAECGDLPGALAACQQAKKVHARAGTLQTPGGRSVLKHLRNLEDQQQLQLQQRSRTDEG